MENSLQTRKIEVILGVPATDEDLKNSFILKSSSKETRRTYRNTLLEFARYYQKRHKREMNLASVTFDDVQAWRDFLISENKPSHYFDKTGYFKIAL